MEEDNRKIMNSLKTEGREEGIKEGKESEKIEIAKALLSSGIDINIISSSTGLSIERINKLK